MMSLKIQNYSSPSFSGDTESKSTALGRICSDFVMQDKFETSELSFAEKVFTLPSTFNALFFGASFFTGTNIFRWAKNRRMLADKTITPAKSKLNNKAILQSFAFNQLGVLVAAGLLYFGGKFSENHNKKKVTKIVDEFSRKNQVVVKLEYKKLAASLVGVTKPLSGEISIAPQLALDFLSSILYLEATVKHELRHFDQFGKVACLDDGINKLNYATLKMTVANLSPEAVGIYKNANEEMKNGVPDKYKNKKIKVDSLEVSLVDYVRALNIVMNEKNPDIKSLPIVINVELYEKIRQKTGKLSTEAEKDAEENLQAMCEYKMPTPDDVKDKNSTYNKNILEIKANKA